MPLMMSSLCNSCLCMSLPQDNTNWNMVTIIILQSTSDTKKLSTTDVTTHLRQEYSHLTGSESTDSALAMCTGKTSKLANKSNKHCTYEPCCKQGHLEANCWMKKHGQNKQDEGNSKRRTRKGRRLLWKPRLSSFPSLHQTYCGK